MADDAARLKTIADNIERLYQSMRRAAGHIAGLLQLGQATCQEVRAYNLWALATYNTQRGMLETMRANGEVGVPSLPPAPTLFTWKGVVGEDAWRIDCGGSTGLQGLRGALRGAMKGPTSNTQYLSTNEIQIVTQDPNLMNPERAPSFATLYAVQTARAQEGVSGLGALPVVLIAVAGIAIAVSVAVVAVMRFLEVSAIQEANSKQVALQADAYAKYLAARLECFKTCTDQGGKAQACVDTCRGLVKEPNITLPGQKKPWTWLQWTGFTVVAGVGVAVAWTVFNRHRSGKPIFQLPEAP